MLKRIHYYNSLLENGMVMLLIFLFVLATLAIPAHSLQYSYEKNEEQILTNKGNEVVRYIESRFQEVIACTEMFELYTLGNQDTEKFDTIAAEILSRHPIIDSISIAPEGVITKTYQTRNSGTQIGYESIRLTNNSESLILPKNHKKIFTTDPVELAPDLWGEKVYVPFFSDDDKFWGFIVFAINLTEVFKSDLMTKILGADAILNISYTNTISNQSVAMNFNPNAETFPVNKVFTLNMLGKWQIHLADKEQALSRISNGLITFLLSFVLSGFGTRLFLSIRRKDNPELKYYIYDKSSKD